MHSTQQPRRKFPGRHFRRRARRRVGTFAAVLALLVQALLPAWHGPAMAAAAKMQATAGEDISVVICTLYGYQVVPLSSLIADAGSKDHQAPAKQPRNCALCQALQQQDVLAPPDLAVIPGAPLAIALSPWLAIGGDVLPAGPHTPAQARAPPVSLA